MENKLNMKKKGFTLAEVLITITIVGVVAVVVLPNLIKKNQERITVNKVKQTYAILNQALKMSELENGPIANWNLAKTSDDAITLISYLKPYLKIAKDCGLEDPNTECASNNYKFLKYSGTAANYADSTIFYKVLLNNGVSLIMRGGVNGKRVTINIDTNGPKPPNIVGKDLFEFDSVGNVLLPNGMPGTENSGQCCTTASSCKGWACPSYVIKNGNMNYLH